MLTSSFTFRMPDTLRKQLDEAVKNSGRSASQELIFRLNASFYKDRETTDRPIHALCYLIAKLARDVVGTRVSDGKPLYNWRSNRFFFRAFKTAVMKLFDALEPRGDLTPPPLEEAIRYYVDTKALDGLIDVDFINSMQREEIESFRSPEKRGKYAAKIRLNLLLHADRDVDVDYFDARPELAALKEEILNNNRGQSNARDDLGINLRKGRL